MSFFNPQVAVDLGTINTLVHTEGRGIVLQEPSVVAIEDGGTKIVNIGYDAQEMLGRTPDHIEVMRPLRDGVIADYFVTEAFLKYFIEKAVGRVPFRRPTIIIAHPYGVTSVERRAIREAGRAAGARDVRLIPEPLAAAIGAGLPIGTPVGNMVVDLGGGSSEAAVVAVNGIVAADSVRVGGLHLDEAIIAYIRRKYNLVIGQPTAEQVKINIGSAVDPDPFASMQVHGRDQITGLPKTMELRAVEIHDAMSEPLTAIIQVVRSVMSQTPPELSSDIIDRGVALTGGIALLRNIDLYITQETGVPAYIADNPMACTVLGAGRALSDWAVLQRAIPDL